MTLGLTYEHRHTHAYLNTTKEIGHQCEKGRRIRKAVAPKRHAVKGSFCIVFRIVSLTHRQSHAPPCPGNSICYRAF